MAELRPHLDAPPPPYLDLQAALLHAATGVQTDPFFPQLRLRMRPPPASASASAASAASASASAGAGAASAASASAGSVGTSAAAAASAAAYDAWRRLSLQLEVEGPLVLLLHPRNARRCGEHLALTT